MRVHDVPAHLVIGQQAHRYGSIAYFGMDGVIIPHVPHSGHVLPLPGSWCLLQFPQERMRLTARVEGFGRQPRSARRRPCRAVIRNPCMGLPESSPDFAAQSASFLSLVISLVQPLRRLSSVPTANRERRRAQGRSRSAVARTSPQPQALLGRTLTAPSTTANGSGWADVCLHPFRLTITRGARIRSARDRAGNLVFGGPG